MKNLSYSSISLYEQCPKKFEHKYVLETSVPEEQVDAFDIGKVAEMLLEKCLKESVSIANFYWRDKYQELVKEYPGIEGWDVTMMRMISNAYDLIVEMGFDASRYFEFQKKIEIDGFIGFIDFLFENREGELIAVDFKTASYPYTKHMVVSSDQLQLYCMLLSLENVYVKKYAYVVMLKKSLDTQVLITDVISEDMSDIAIKAESLKKVVREGIFYKNPKSCIQQWGNTYYSCPYYNHCWEDKPVRVLNTHKPMADLRF